MKKALVAIVLLAAVFLLGSFWGRNALRRQLTTQVDTTVIRHEIVDSGAILRAVLADGYELTRVGLVDSLLNIPPRVVEMHDTVPVLVRYDSVVYIQVPMEKRLFEGRRDSVYYQITTRGYNTELLETRFSYPERVVNTTVYVPRVEYRKGHVGVGGSVGASALYNRNGVHAGLGATVGVTFSF